MRNRRCTSAAHRGPVSYSTADRVLNGARPAWRRNSVERVQGGRHPSRWAMTRSSRRQPVAAATVTGFPTFCCPRPITACFARAACPPLDREQLAVRRKDRIVSLHHRDPRPRSEALSPGARGAGHRLRTCLCRRRDRGAADTAAITALRDRGRRRGDAGGRRLRPRPDTAVCRHRQRRWAAARPGGLLRIAHGRRGRA